MEEKYCCQCQQTKPLDEFHKNKKRKSGRHPYCKACRSKESKNNPQLQKYKKEWYQKNRQLTISRVRERAEKNKESLWLPTMSWQNYGEWHIDHIRPVSSFSPDTPPTIVNALSNLRPMWATSRYVNGVFYEGNLNKNARWN